MATYTTTATGSNWSDTTHWTPTPGAGGPGNGDTVTISHSTTVDVDTTVGSSPSTGGTPAITFGTGGNLTLTIASGKTLTCKGDIKVQSDGSYSTVSSVTMAAGSSLVFLPPSGQQYKLDFRHSTQLVCNGSSGSRCTVKTDLSSGGLQSIMTQANVAPCLRLATYTDFQYFGTTSAVGVQSSPYGSTYTSAIVDISITNCTFTSSTYQFAPSSSGWNKNFTFTNNIFGSTFSGWWAVGRPNCSASFSWPAPSGGTTRTVQYCGFDRGAMFTTCYDGTIADCVFGSQFFTDASGSPTYWQTAAQFARNFILHDTTITDNAPINGPTQDCYMRASGGGHNPHYCGAGTYSTGFSGWLFESPDGYKGDCIFPRNGDFSVKYCIVLPDDAGQGSGCLLSCLGTASAGVKYTIEHNTWCGKSSDSSLAHVGETVPSTAGEIDSCRANIIWQSSGSGAGYCVAVGDRPQTPTLDAVTVAGYNAFDHPNTNNITANGATVSAKGYDSIKVTAAGFPSSQVGTGDLDITATGCQFADPTRRLATWGATQGADGTAAGAIALLVSNPSLVGQANTGLLAWVRAGWRPKNASLKAASYPGDTSTADAAGNPWPGGAPGIGAMGWTDGLTGGAAALLCGL